MLSHMSWAHWSDGYIKIYIVGEVLGSKPADSHYILYNNINQTNGGHVAPMDWATCILIIHHQLDTCQLPIRHPTTNKNLPRHHCMAVRSVRPCHVRPYGLYGLVQSASKKKFLFALMNRSRYLLHTDSIWQSKYTAGIRKTRQTQWHCFRRIPSTLKFEQNLIPWSHLPIGKLLDLQKTISFNLYMRVQFPRPFNFNPFSFSWICAFETNTKVHHIPRFEVLVFLSRIVSSCNSERYSGEKSSSEGIWTWSPWSSIKGGSYNLKLSTLTTAYICI